MKKEFLKEQLRQLPLELEETQISQLLTYYEMLIEKNKVMNLTAITEYEEVVIKHFIDSLMLIRAVPVSVLQEKNCLADLGTGAGFPGIPLKIAFPFLNVVLMDSLQKRIVFLEEVIRELQLNQIAAVHGRAEDLGRLPEYREQFDFCVSRAVANLATLSEYCLPFVKNGGQFAAYKSGQITEELQQAKKAVFLLSGKVDTVTEFVLPGSDMRRSIVLIRKTGPISKKYPRNPGKPGKDPLH